MMKILAPLILGGAIGFGGGVWYSSAHPESASKVAATEQHDVIAGQLKVAQTATDQLNKAIAARTGKPDDSGMVSTSTLIHLRNDEQAKVNTLQAELNGQ